MGNLRDFATGLVALEPSPATSGTTLTVHSGQGARMPTVPFSITAHPYGVLPTLDNAEKLLVTDVTDDTFTVVREQGETTAKEIAAGWVVSNAVFAADVSEGKLPVAVVAASDAPQWIKNIATYQCNGTDDHLELQDAFDTYSYVYCSEGVFNCADDITLAGDGTASSRNTTFAGSGDEITEFSFASGKGFILKEAVKIRMEDMMIRVSGAGDGVKSLNGTGAMKRAFWKSYFRNINVVGDFSTHTGWAFNLENPFRSTFMNLTAVGVKNGMRLASADPTFNPGNCTFIGLFMELNLPDGIGYQLWTPDGGGNLNILTFIECDAQDSATSTSSIGWHFRGSTTSYWRTKDIKVLHTNTESFNTVAKFEDAEQVDFITNYVNVEGDGTAFIVDSDSKNIHIRPGNLNIANGQTVEILTDNNADANNPTVLYGAGGYNDSGTMTITTQVHTVLRDLSVNGPGTFPTEYSNNTPITPVRGAGGGGSTLSKTLYIENPVADENLTYFRTDVAITIAEVVALVSGDTSPSASIQINHSTDRASVSPNTLFATEQTITDTTTGTSLTTFDDATIPANSWIWVTTTGSTATSIEDETWDVDEGGWTNTYLATAVQSGGKIRVTNTSAAFGSTTKTLTVVSGKQYRIEFNGTQGTATLPPAIHIGTDATYNAYAQAVASGVVTTITATATDLKITLSTESDVDTEYQDFDDILVEELDDSVTAETITIDARYTED